MPKKITVEHLRKVAQQTSYSFTVGDTGVSDVPLEELARGKKPAPKPKEQAEAEFRRIESEKRRGRHEHSGLLPELSPGWDATNPNAGTAIAWENHQHDAAYDLRAYVPFRDIKSQGSCGACWAFAAVGLLEVGYGLYFERQVDLSPQQIVNCRTGACSVDFTLDDTFAYLADVGVPSWADVPFAGTEQPCVKRVRECFGANLHSHGSSSTVVRVKEQIVEWAGVASYIHATNHLLHFTGGVFDEFADATGKDGHFVVIIGWDDSKQHRRGKGAWLVRNSWGKGWGEAGYGWIAYGCNEIADPAYVADPLRPGQKLC